MKKRAREHVAETRNALQTFFDELNQGSAEEDSAQQKSCAIVIAITKRLL